MIGIDTDNDGTDKTVYAYDAENRLISVDSGITASYAYGAQGRRISKTVGVNTTVYVYDGDQVIAEYDGTTLLRKFIYGPGIDEPICMVVPDGSGGEDFYWYHFDGLGSVVALSNDSGSIVESYSYDAYGKTTVTLDGSLGNPYRYTARRLDDETGLYYYRARMYKPQIGRFLQPDPIGYDDGMNMYAYVGNNHVNGIDPSGTNIYLKTGNDTWNPVNNLIHQNIVVDNWRISTDSNGEIKYDSNGKLIYESAG